MIKKRADEDLEFTNCVQGEDIIVIPKFLKEAQDDWKKEMNGFGGYLGKGKYEIKKELEIAIFENAIRAFKEEKMKKINKEEVLRKLNERDYLRKLHRVIAEGLVGSMRNEYLMTPTGDTLERKRETFRMTVAPVFRAIVDMLTAFLVGAVAEKLVDEVLEVIDEGNE